MVPTELLRYVVQVFERLGIDYFITGSVASITYGEVRMTADVDFVARIELQHVKPLCAAFSDDRFYISEEGVREAIINRSQFNIIDASGFKADIMLPKAGGRDQERFQRAVRMQLPGEAEAYWFASAEDLILSKLLFFQEGQSEKHLRDIAGIMKVMGDELDMRHIIKWVSRLQLDETWHALQQRLAEP